jgi:hypothetical protein
MKCSEKACPFPARQEGLCAGHLRDRTLGASVIGGSIPLMQEFALAEGARGFAAGVGNRAGHHGPYKSAEL